MVRRSPSQFGSSKDFVHDSSNWLLCEVSCPANMSDIKNCFAVDGQLTLYTGDGVDEDGTVLAVKKAIETAMNHGELDNAQKDIIKVRYMMISGQGDGGETGIEGDSDPEDDPDLSSTGGVRVSLLIAAGAAGIVVAAGIGFAYRKHRKNLSEEESEMSTRPPAEATPEAGEEITDIP